MSYGSDKTMDDCKPDHKSFRHRKGHKRIPIRVCYLCGTNHTRLSNGKYEMWYHYGKEFVCDSCYRYKLIRSRLYEANKKHLTLTPNRKRIGLKFNPRIGVCNLCRAVVNVDCKTTNMHHDQDHYDLENPLKYAIEVCPTCHNKQKIDKTRYDLPKTKI